MTDGRTRLTEGDVARLRAMRAEGFKYGEIAKEFSISVSGAHAIVTGKTRTKPIGHRAVAPIGKRFYSQVRRDSDGCWRWKGRRSNSGYGQFKVSSRTKNAHRVAYTLKHGKVPPGLFVLHRCDVKTCVRPSHLYAGTAKQNTRDAIERGAYPIGTRNGNSKLTPELVRAIRSGRRRGEPLRSLALRYGVGTSTVSSASLARTWAHVDEAVS